MDIRPEMLDLVRAFNEVRLAALHIDLQSCFFNEAALDARANTAVAYPVVNEFAKFLRECDVPNIWVAFTKQVFEEERLALASETQSNPRRGYRACLRSHPDFHHSIEVKPSELVFYKNEEPALKTKTVNPLDDFLRRSQFDTLIIDGVKYNHCVQETAIVAAGLEYQVYIPIDATNCPSIDYDNYPKLMTMGLAPEVKDRIHFTNTHALSFALKSVQVDMPKIVAA